MPSYWPDKPHPPAHRSKPDKIAYWLYRKVGLRSRFWARIWHEHEVRRILKILARQQVYGFVANPEGGDPIWYIEAPENVQENRYPLNTCLLRGWAEQLDMGSQSYKGFPIAQPLIPRGGSFDDFPKPPYYRLTTAGWNAIYRQYTVARIALLISFLALSISALNAIHRTTAAHSPTVVVAPPAKR